MNRWIRFIIKSSKLYDHKQFREMILEADKPIKTLNDYFSRDEVQEIKKLNDRIDSLKSREKTILREIENKEKRIKEQSEKLSYLKDKFIYQSKEKDKWNNKHDKKLVKYRRPIWDGDNFHIKAIPVTLFIAPNDRVIKKRLLEDNLRVSNPMEINKIAPKIYNLAKENYDYEYDSKNLGISEFWQFPFETRNNNGDCEDWANLIASYLIAAGVPSWRVRVTYGMINSGEGGHSTVYVLDDDMKTWRHLNSTSPSYDYRSLDDYPKFGDLSDSLGIDPEKVWGSFSDRHSWVEMSNETKKKFKEHKISNKLVVK